MTSHIKRAMASYNSILDPVKHESLISNMAWVCQSVGITTEHLSYPMKLWTGKSEREWFCDYAGRMGGAYYEGVLRPHSHVQRMMAIAGAFSRSFIDARIIPLGTAIEMPDADLPTVLLIPNFGDAVRGDVANWCVGKVNDLLHRSYSCRRLVVHMDKPGDETEKNPYPAQFVREHYAKLGA